MTRGMLCLCNKESLQNNIKSEWEGTTKGHLVQPPVFFPFLKKEGNRSGKGWRKRCGLLDRIPLRHYCVKG